jgi:hypothetical protein
VRLFRRAARQKMEQLGAESSIKRQKTNAPFRDREDSLKSGLMISISKDIGVVFRLTRFEVYY